MALSGSEDFSPGGAARPLIGITTYSQEAAWGVWKGTAALIPGT